MPGYTQLSSPYSTQYKRISIKADFGAKVVARGDSIGFVGRYGTGPHLNISATKDGASIDPATIIKP